MVHASFCPPGSRIAFLPLPILEAFPTGETGEMVSVIMERVAAHDLVYFSA